LGTGFPENVEVFLCNSIAYLMASHVNGSRSLSADGVIHDAVGSAHGLEGCSCNFAFFGVYEKGADFHFCGRGGDVFENASGVKDGTVIDFGFVCVVA
jgi:hypothetical protein